MDCVLCGKPATDKHHYVHRWHGDDTPENLYPLCRIHHDAVHRGEAWATAMLRQWRRLNDR